MDYNEKRAHDLAILYMQLEIKEGKITYDIRDDVKPFLDEYQNLFSKFLTLL